METGLLRTHVPALSPYCSLQHQHCASISMRMRSQETFFKDSASGSFKFQFGAPGKHCEDGTAVSANHEHLGSLAEWGQDTLQKYDDLLLFAVTRTSNSRLAEPPPARPCFWAEDEQYCYSHATF